MLTKTAKKIRIVIIIKSLRKIVKKPENLCNDQRRKRGKVSKKWKCLKNIKNTKGDGTI